MTEPKAAPKVPGPNDDAIQAVSAAINELRQQFEEAKKAGDHKATLDALKAELTELRAELAALKKGNAPPKGPELVPEPEDDGVFSFFDL